jgi:hypothetical protein
MCVRTAPLHCAVRRMPFHETRLSWRSWLLCTWVSQCRYAPMLLWACATDHPIAFSLVSKRTFARIQWSPFAGRWISMLARQPRTASETYSHAGTAGILRLGIESQYRSIIGTHALCAVYPPARYPTEVSRGSGGPNIAHTVRYGMMKCPKSCPSPGRGDSAGRQRFLAPLPGLTVALYLSGSHT